jgi:hypothetical protein
MRSYLWQPDRRSEEVDNRLQQNLKLSLTLSQQFRSNFLSPRLVGRLVRDLPASAR